MTPLARDLATVYQARLGGTAPLWPPLPVRYADYTLWQREWLGSADDPDSPLSRQLAHWTAALDGALAQLALPTGPARPATLRGARIPFTMGSAAHAGLAALARTEHTSVFMAVRATLSALLTPLGAGPEVPIGTPVAGPATAHWTSWSDCSSTPWCCAPTGYPLDSGRRARHPTQRTPPAVGGRAAAAAVLLARCRQRPRAPGPKRRHPRRLVRRQLARTPDRIAVTDGGTSLTYRRLDRRSHELAQRLAAHGSAPERLVALVLERSADLVAACLAVLRTGAAYVPVDPAYPAERVGYVLATPPPSAS